ncbi:hypothetical protein [Rhodococcoides corynebacterioides]|uniref:hypothetical protein n=1 Tax=Rhodococcoides corynebacterioides TaxID=53972 RepID=UPI001C9B673B|nr:hypothetical protein [Rhodococcus corynebacterioides]MBY6351283.1 hypothetical protein [Rhodococcus corynebacterioides]MBY6364978.1 hypothetical protein [Rhodococcus corynebacterioides]
MSRPTTPDPTGPDFSVDDVTTGPYAHGFGTAADGRAFAFRVRGKTLRVELYRLGATVTVPTDVDVDAVADVDVTDVDLCDERSVTAAVRDAVATVHAPDDPRSADTTLVRALLGRLDPRGGAD